MAIIGNGSIAKLLNDREGFVFFAAGNSNSQGVPESEMFREWRAIESAATATDEMFVYFSSISIFLKKTDYTYVKKMMEEVVRRSAINYTIIRLGNVWECTNPNTFINAIKSQLEREQEVDIRENEIKYMISKNQLNFITDNLPRIGKHEISIFGEALTVSECLKR